MVLGGKAEGGLGKAAIAAGIQTLDHSPFDCPDTVVDPILLSFTQNDEHATMRPSLHVVAACMLAIFPISLIVLIHQIRRKASRHRSVTILVLGDVGRSPRMMYHAHSLVTHEWTTHVVGYGDTTPISALLESPFVHLHALANPPSPLLACPWVVRAPARIVWQIWSTLKICLWDVPIHTEILLVQNPPSIPTLALAQIICAVSGAKLIIDWHNTGYSILAMRTGEQSPLCRIAKWFEARYGRVAFAHLFVTRALQEYLVPEWKLQGKTAVLHDRPPPHFHRTPPMLQHELFARITSTLLPPLPVAFQTKHATQTLFTVPAPNGMPTLKADRPALVVSSTSWTADEDFSPFIQALDMYQQAIDKGAQLPRLVVIVTGKGALRDPFEHTVAKRETGAWRDVCVRCAFLSASDYPRLLGSADLGVSMHSSSSGRDLPMKVVDMFGCGVPVVARGFRAIGELVMDGYNGKVWWTAEELGQQMIDLLTDFPNNPDLDRLQSFFTPLSRDSPGSHHSVRRRRSRSGLVHQADEEWTSWEENWDRVMHRGILARS